MHNYSDLSIPSSFAQRPPLPLSATMVSHACAVIGARGYSGIELSRLLLQHPACHLHTAYATSGFELKNYIDTDELNHQHLRVGHHARSALLDGDLSDLPDVVFLATPAEVSLALVPQLIGKGKKVIDLSGAFRLKKHDYKKWYRFDHDQHDLLQQALYGLQPWLQLDQHKLSARQPLLIANPGCYATAILLALLPLVQQRLIKLETIVIDAKSGTSGAGRKASENLLFTEVQEDVLPYKIGQHQHWPEIVEAVEAFTGETIKPMMTTHLLPVRRGITAAIYARVQKGVEREQVLAAYQKAYEHYALLKYRDLSDTSAQINTLSLRKIVGTAMTHVSFDLVDDQIYVFSIIDNLLKGAASQAIENLNAMHGLDLQVGLQIKGIL